MSNKDRLFGGYTKSNWKSPENEIYSSDKDAFLIQFDERTKLNQIENNKKIICINKNRMCAFGEKDKLDLKISENSYSSNSSSQLGNSFEIPEGKDSSWFAGSSIFKIIEIEVYTVKFL